MTDATETDLSGMMLGRRYELRRKLGQGGMGVVYEAWQADLGRTVAIKLLLDLGEDALARFQREARAAAGLGHPHIAQVHDFHAGAGEPPYLVMELLPGCSLGELMRREGPLSPERVARIGTHMLSALGAAHRAGIVHRDIKPANVFVYSTSTLGEVAKVLDFGIAKILSPSAANLTQAGTVLGTLAYMSPEQARGAELDGRSDIYSTAAVLYHAVVGRRPIRGDDTASLLLAIVQGQVLPLQQLRPDLDPTFCAIIHRGLAIEPANRYRTAEEMEQALQTWAERRPSAIAVDSPTVAARIAPPSTVAPVWPAPSPPSAAYALGGSTVYPTLGTAPLPPPRAPWVLVAVAASALLLAAGGVAAWWIATPGGKATPGGSQVWGSAVPASSSPRAASSARAAGSARAGEIGWDDEPGAGAGQRPSVGAAPKQGGAQPPAPTTPTAPSRPTASNLPPGAPCYSDDCGPNSFCTSIGCECSNPYQPCNGACVDYNHDARNCGSCGHACGAGEICQGRCWPCVGPRFAMCGGRCISVEYDEKNCGSCGRICPASKNHCRDGQCL